MPSTWKRPGPFRRCLTIMAPLLLWMGAVASSSQDESRRHPTNSLIRGCLHNKLSNQYPLRVCNSEDHEAHSHYCRPPEFDYLEIRIKCQDWESVLFGSWILQILLTEVLGVPTTLETGRYHAVSQFYDAAARFDFGTTSNNLQAFRNAMEVAVDVDCRTIRQPLDVNDTTYIHCAHVIPEVWTARSAQVQAYISEGILDPPTALGALGVEGWFVPKWTVEQDPTLTSWIGLAGPHNRKKLAATFLRPITWLDYCQQVSPTNCTIRGPAASREM